MTDGSCCFYFLSQKLTCHVVLRWTASIWYHLLFPNHHTQLKYWNGLTFCNTWAKTSPPHWVVIILWPGVVLELEEVMEAVDAVVGSRTFTAAFVALWIAGAWNGKVEWFGILPAVVRTEASKRMEVLWNAATVATRVRIYHLPLYSSVNSSLVCGIISAERGLSLRRMYGCTEVPYSTSDHSFSLPAATRAAGT